MFYESDHPVDVVCPTCKENYEKDVIHEFVEFPKEIANRWDDILKAVGITEEWFADYSDGFIPPENDGIPERAPLIVNNGRIYNGNPSCDHYGFGTYCIFRCTNEIHNEFMKQYDNKKSGNEEFIPDGDHVIVIYMI